MYSISSHVRLCVCVCVCAILDSFLSTTQMRELENTHHERVTEIGLQHLEKFVKNQLEEDLPDELRMVRGQRSTLRL